MNKGTGYRAKACLFSLPDTAYFPVAILDCILHTQPSPVTFITSCIESQIALVNIFFW